MEGYQERFRSDKNRGLGQILQGNVIKERRRRLNDLNCRPNGTTPSQLAIQMCSEGAPKCIVICLEKYAFE